MLNFRDVLQVKAFKRRAPEMKALGIGALPRFASGLADVDLVAGGFYGLAVVGGPPKSGKSLLALRSAIETAQAAGLLVVYVDFELDRFTYAKRMLGAVGVRKLDELPTWAIEQLRVIDGGDCNVQEFADQVAMQIDEQAERVLVVIDSINRMAKNQQRHERGGNYFAHLGSIVSWARNAVTLTNGDISALLVSEVNRAGSITGQDPEYSADCYATLRRVESPAEVEIEFTSRSTAGFAPKVYLRDGHLARFTPLDAQGAGNDAEHQPSAADRAANDDTFGGPVNENLFDMASYRRPKGG